MTTVENKNGRGTLLMTLGWITLFFGLVSQSDVFKQTIASETLTVIITVALFALSAALFLFYKHTDSKKPIQK